MDLPPITAVERLHLHPDEKLVIHVNVNTTPAEVERLKAAAAEHLNLDPSRFVVMGGIRLEIVRMENEVLP